MWPCAGSACVLGDSVLESVGVAQLHKIDAGVGVLDACVGGMLQPQRKLVRTLVPKVHTYPHMAGKVKPGAHALAVVIQPLARDHDAGSSLHKPRRCTLCPTPAQAGADTQRRGGEAVVVKVFVGPATKPDVPVAAYLAAA